MKLPADPEPIRAFPETERREVIKVTSVCTREAMEEGV